MKRSGPLNRSAPLKRSGPIRRRRARHSTDANAAMRLRVYAEQDESCAWCRRWLPLEGSIWRRFHLCHLEDLRMGGSRHDANNWRNQREHVVGLCKKHHDELATYHGEEREAMNQALRVASLPRDGHGSRRTGA